MNNATNSTPTLLPEFGQWEVANTVVVIGMLFAVALICIIVLCICIGCKVREKKKVLYSSSFLTLVSLFQRRLMAVRSTFVPVLDQKGITKRQKKCILDEHEYEVGFRMEPGGTSSLYGWFNGASKEMRDIGTVASVFFFFFFFSFLFFYKLINAIKLMSCGQWPKKPTDNYSCLVSPM
jgi:hypothetical protein